MIKRVLVAMFLLCSLLVLGCMTDEECRDICEDECGDLGLEVGSYDVTGRKCTCFCE